MTCETPQLTDMEKEVRRLEGCLRVAQKAMTKKVPAFETGKPRYAFLVLQEHPYGRLMLQKLLDAGHPPVIVIEENDNPDGVSIAQEEREKFLERIGKHTEELPDTIAKLCADNNIERVVVAQHNFSDCLHHLIRTQPRLLVLGGTRVMRDPVLSFPVDGCVNAHPGLLPECRGSASPAWSVYHDIPIGSTCHICSSGVDTGDMLYKERVKVPRGANYGDLCWDTLYLSGVLMAKAVVHYAEHGNFDALRTKQGESEFETFHNAPPEVLEVVYKKLEDKTYKHYAD
eukprot:GEMP01053578.1.p1 GENE.GEMP01053578.1~~GEMP01053578.1.p1  ORF type:complete len:303 (+),score=61.64 GEMP01053578.1:54-911(+)